VRTVRAVCYGDAVRVLRRGVARFARIVCARIAHAWTALVARIALPLFALFALFAQIESVQCDALW
jgi:hypothetical protein